MVRDLAVQFDDHDARGAIASRTARRAVLHPACPAAAIVGPSEASRPSPCRTAETKNRTAAPSVQSVDRTTARTPGLTSYVDVASAAAAPRGAGPTILRSWVATSSTRMTTKHGRATTCGGSTTRRTAAATATYGNGFGTKQIILNNELFGITATAPATTRDDCCTVASATTAAAALHLDAHSTQPRVVARGESSIRCESHNLAESIVGCCPLHASRRRRISHQHRVIRTHSDTRRSVISRRRNQITFGVYQGVRNIAAWELCDAHASSLPNTENEKPADDPYTVTTSVASSVMPTVHVSDVFALIATSNAR